MTSVPTDTGCSNYDAANILVNAGRVFGSGLKQQYIMKIVYIIFIIYYIGLYGGILYPSCKI